MNPEFSLQLIIFPCKVKIIQVLETQVYSALNNHAHFLLAVMVVRHKVGNIYRHIYISPRLADTMIIFVRRRNSKDTYIFQTVYLHSGGFRQSVYLAAIGSTALQGMGFISFNLNYQKVGFIWLWMSTQLA